MPVSIIIVSHDSGPLLIECVQCALASTASLEVLVSDNDSHDGSVEALEEVAEREPRLGILKNGRNLGFAAANNRALSLATGEYVLFLNPDCLVRPDTVGRVVAALETCPEAGMAGCLIRNPDGSIEENCVRRMPTPRSLLGELFGHKESVVAGAEVEAISGAFMLVRRADLDRIGSFDEGYFLHWEDLDLCCRFRDAGRRILFVPDAEVVHFKGRSSQRRPLWVEWQKHRGLMRFFRKFHFAGPCAVFYPIVASAIALRFLFHAVLRRRQPVAGTAITEGASLDGGGPEVWVFGATSLVGRYLLPRLLAAGYRVRAFSRDPTRARIGVSPRLTLSRCNLNVPDSLPSVGQPDAVISLAPIFALPNVLPALAQRDVRQVIAFGSTSALTKADSADEGERALAKWLRDGEAAVRRECEAAGIRWAVFRPTMIYSPGNDRNVTRIAEFVQRFGFFLLPGEGRGLRQPVHADDLAKACIDRLASPNLWNRIFDLSGGETLSYRAMVERVFRSLGRSPWIIRIPDSMSRAAVAFARLIPAYRDVSVAMLKRIDADMSFAHDEATRAFGFMPRKFLS